MTHQNTIATRTQLAAFLVILAFSLSRSQATASELVYRMDDPATRNIVAINNLLVPERGLYDVQFESGSVSDVFGGDFGSADFREPEFWGDMDGARAAIFSMRDLFHAQESVPTQLDGDGFSLVLYGQSAPWIEAYGNRLFAKDGRLGHSYRQRESTGTSPQLRAIHPSAWTVVANHAFDLLRFGPSFRFPQSLNSIHGSSAPSG